MPLPSNGKLVRDKIPEIIRATGQTPTVITLPAEDRSQALRVKAQEEAHELANATPAEITEELADLLEILVATSEAEGVAWSAVTELAHAKRRERGGFTQGYWLLGD